MVDWSLLASLAPMPLNVSNWTVCKELHIEQSRTSVHRPWSPTRRLHSFEHGLVNGSIAVAVRVETRLSRGQVAQIALNREISTPA